MSDRTTALTEWLINTLKTNAFELTPLAGDASFRRYFRLHHQGTTQIVMDAPPGHENLDSFIKVGHLLSEAGLHTPLILAQERTLGFLLLSDLGEALLLEHLNKHTANNYYHQAFRELFKIQAIPVENTQLAPFNKAFMLQEMNAFTEWFLAGYLNLKLNIEAHQCISNAFDWLTTEIAQQPVVVIHRDFHSRNLMLLQGSQSLGIIDFQDAMIGPITYDLASLLKDSYISWPRAKVLEWVQQFYANHAWTSSFEELTRAFDLCGVQRHLKNLGVFARLYLRDNKPRYLSDLPLTLNYVLECTEIYKELHPLYDFFQEHVRLP